MTRLPKWAFATKEAADAFVTQNGGKFGNWEEVLAESKSEIDTVRTPPVRRVSDD